MRSGALALGAAALMVVPAIPASATPAAETCHPPRYDTVACACLAVARVLTKVTGETWTCDTA